MEERERRKEEIPLEIWLGGVTEMGLRESEEAIDDRRRREKERRGFEERENRR